MHCVLIIVMNWIYIHELRFLLLDCILHTLLLLIYYAGQFMTYKTVLFYSLLFLSHMLCIMAACVVIFFMKLMIFHIARVFYIMLRNELVNIVFDNR